MDYHYNKLTPAEAERLAILSEECGEVIQIIGKILRHGYKSSHPEGGPTNRKLLAFEIGDVITAVLMMTEIEDINNNIIDERVEYKLEKIKKYLHHQ